MLLSTIKVIHLLFALLLAEIQANFITQDDYSKCVNKERAISYSNGDIPLTFNGSPNSVFPAIHTSVLFLF